MSFLLKNLFIALSISLIVGIGYYFFFAKSSSDVNNTDAMVSSEAKQQTEKILADTKRISEYNLDDSIFKDQRFLSLVDTRVNIGDPQVGRNDPFAPVQ